MIVQNEPPNLFYRGFSMKGTFKVGDRLSLEKIHFNQIRRGDLIVFTRSRHGNTEYVVHRVRGIRNDGLIMRGDNCTMNDQEKVTMETIVGRVIRFARNHRVYGVRNGWRGAVRGARLQSQLKLKRCIKGFIQALYRSSFFRGPVTRIWHPELQAIYFLTPEGPLVKYTHKRRTAASYWVRKDLWICRFPYDLVINRKQL